MQIQKNEQTDKLYTRDEAAIYLGVSPETLRSWATRKKDALPYRRVGRKVQYTKTDLDNYIETRKRR